MLMYFGNTKDEFVHFSEKILLLIIILLIGYLQVLTYQRAVWLMFAVHLKR